MLISKPVQGRKNTNRWNLFGINSMVDMIMSSRQFWRTATSTADAKPFVALTRVLHCIEHMFMKGIAMFLLSITAE